MHRRVSGLVVITLALVSACGGGTSDGGDASIDAARSDAGLADTGTPPVDGGPTCTPSGATESACTGGVDEDCDGRIDCADPDCEGMTCVAGATCTAGGCVPTGLFPDAPPITGVRARVDGDRVSVTFEPVAGARDYRIFPLPAAGSVNVDADGYEWIEGATYRCGGDREAQRTNFDVAQTVYRFDRTEADATLGYVFLEPAADRVPVYRLGDPQGEPAASGSCWVSWSSARVAIFTADLAEHDRLVGQGWRDDGIQFYAPIAGAGTTHVFFDTTDDYAAAGAPTGPRRIFYTHGAEYDAHHGAGEPEPAIAFDVLTSTATGAVPLLRVFYTGLCNPVHDELAAGTARFERILRQGNQPIWEVQWSGIGAPTTFVIEALDAGCPFQGHLAPSDVPARSGAYAQPFVSIASARAAAMHGEVFVNGQHDPASRPRPIARASVDVVPGTSAAMDWSHSFSASEPTETFAVVSTVNHGGDDITLESSSFFAQLYAIEPGFASVGVVSGELWADYADWGSDVNGKVRFTPRQHATMAAGSFVHATMQADFWATGRRYPQLWISSVDSPVQERLTDGVTINVQPIQGWPSVLQVQLCDHRTWDVNNQCPVFHTEPTPFSDEPWPPRDLAGEHAGVMRLARLDVWASTGRVYVFLDGTPWACADLPAGAFPAGAATVTFGDVLYHSGVDEAVVGADSVYVFHRDHMLTETRRVFDGLGFSSGLPAPAWNETLIPCATRFD